MDGLRNVRKDQLMEVNASVLQTIMATLYNGYSIVLLWVRLHAVYNQNVGFVTKPKTRSREEVLFERTWEFPQRGVVC